MAVATVGVIEGGFEIATLLISLALISMLVVRSKQTVEVAQGVGSAFGNLLDAATLNTGAGIGSGYRRY